MYTSHLLATFIILISYKMHLLPPIVPKDNNTGSSYFSHKHKVDPQLFHPKPMPQH